MQIHSHAWLPSSTFGSSEEIEKTIRELQAAGISVANLMLNNVSDKRGETEFELFDIDKIKDMAAACHAAGMTVHATIWVMPHKKYVDGMLAQLPGLLDAIDCKLLVLDAEGPWADATGTFNYAEAAQIISRVFPRLALSGIGSALPELCELAKICKVWGPQVYATINTQATFGGVGPYCYNCWLDRYGEPEEGWIFGLAAYDQGTPAASTMQPVIDDMLALGIKHGCFWTINAIAARSDVTAFVFDLSAAPVEPVDPCEPATPPQLEQDGGIFPLFDIDHMPSGVVEQQLKTVQGMLLAWGIDPGKLDGLPGPKTRDAVKQFQTQRKIPATGIIDDVTWCRLLRRC